MIIFFLIINYILEEKSILHLSSFMLDDKYSYYGKTSSQSKISHYDTKNSLLYAFPLSHSHNQSLIGMK